MSFANGEPQIVSRQRRMGPFQARHRTQMTVALNTPEGLPHDF